MDRAWPEMPLGKMLWLVFGADVNTAELPCPLYSTWMSRGPFLSFPWKLFRSLHQGAGAKAVSLIKCANQWCWWWSSEKKSMVLNSVGCIMWRRNVWGLSFGYLNCDFLALSQNKSDWRVERHQIEYTLHTACCPQQHLHFISNCMHPLKTIHAAKEGLCEA